MLCRIAGLSPPFVEMIRDPYFNYITGGEILLYDNVKGICRERGISILKLEEELGFPRSYICKWNENEPGIWKVQKVADYLGVPIEVLLEAGEPEREVG